jgi:glutaredoxin
MEPIKIYSIPTCPHSFNAKREYDNQGLSYEDINVRTDKEALETMLALNGGQRRVPTIVKGDQVEVGYKGRYCAV